ncbi:MAG: hypothetical protein ACLQVD_01080 [Capsulimonadaceae bacterium]
MVSIPDGAYAKFAYYVAACDQLMRRLAHFRAVAADADNPSLEERCISEFNHALSNFLRVNYGESNQRALKALTDELNVCLQRIPRSDPHAHQILADMVQDVARTINGLDGTNPLANRRFYEQMLRHLHDQALTIALSYFDDPIRLPARQATTCEVFHAQSPVKRMEPPMQCWVERETGGNYHAKAQVTCCVTDRHDFDDYAALLFMFLHEYTAHIFITDNRQNALFHDGWMMYMAALYLYQHASGSDLPAFAYSCTICNRQATAPVMDMDIRQADLWSYLKTVLDPGANADYEINLGKLAIYKVFDFLLHFRPWLFDDEYLRQVTVDLANFDFSGDAPPDWPTRVINRLMAAYYDETLRGPLRVLLQTRPPVRALLAGLTSLLGADRFLM